jgi:aerobic carbon-monoxide dehydrogenase medium subunit
MFSAPFEYICTASLDEAVRLLDERPDDVKLLAGGQSLIPLLKLRLSAPALVVDIGRIAELKAIRETERGIEMGALVRHVEIEHSELLTRACPLLVQTASEIGDPQVRNRGTIGGSLAHADPSADFSAAALALDAKLILTSVAGQRAVAARKFFVGLMSTALAPNEILTEIQIPKLSARAGSAYVKLRQQASGFAIVGVAAVIALDARGTITDARVAITGVGPFPYRAAAVESRLRGQEPRETIIHEAASMAAEGVDVAGDMHASPDYRRELAAIFTRRALASAARRARRSV